MLLKGKNIFIVEDNLQNRIVFQIALVRDGATVDFERHGRETIYRLTTAFPIDLIILDLMLAGGLSGFDLYDQIRAQRGFETIPVIAVSAMDPSVAIPKAREKGMNGFIAKPIDNRLFAGQLARVLEGEQVWYTGNEVRF